MKNVQIADKIRYDRYNTCSCLITVHSEYVNRTNVSLFSLTRKV